MSDAPEHIWTHEDENRRRWFFKAQCMPQASLTTTKYVRADIAAARIAALGAEVADLRLELDVTQSALRTSVSNVMERRLPEAAYARGLEDAALFIEQHCLQDTSEGQVPVRRREGDRSGLAYARAIRAMNDKV
jgi:hypothetical protein